VVILLTVMLLVAAGLGYYFAGITIAGETTTATASTTITSVSTVSPTTSSNSSSPYVLTLAITTNNVYNSTFGEQPAYYIVGPNGLESSANITLPAHQLIELVIINYDNGSATLTNPAAAAVSGTQGGVMTYFNNDVNSSEGSAGIQISGGQTVSNLAADNISHTFTVPALNLNIPIPPSSVVTAYFTLNQTGNFSWFCMTACGGGPTGLEGAMESPGWMMGSMTGSMAGGMTVT
jgi:heme/copper-type cytochrome/quinol oxidase subunit 2